MATRYPLVCYSTAHLREEDVAVAERLAADGIELNARIGTSHFMSGTDYGWLFWVAKDENGHSEVDQEDLASLGFSDAVGNVLKHAVLSLSSEENSCYVLFDSDEPPNDDLPTFDWF